MRYYHLLVTQILFGETIAVRRWRSIGSKGTMKGVISKDLPEAARYIYEEAIVSRVLSVQASMDSVANVAKSPCCLSIM